MEQLEALAHRIDAITGIANVVRTMKTLSAVNIPSAERAAAAISEVYETVLDGLHVAFSAQPAPLVARAPAPPRTILIVFGSDHGLCGGFSDRLAQAASNFDAGDVDVFAIGARVEMSLSIEGIQTRETFRSAASVDGLRALAAELLVAIDSASRDAGADAAISLLHNRRGAGGLVEIAVQHLLPLSAEFIADIKARTWPSNGLPAPLIAAEALMQALVRQYIFISIFRAGAASLAAEHTARLALMTQAERTLARRLEEAEAAYRRARQGQITDELLDLIGGFEALGAGA